MFFFVRERRYRSSKSQTLDKKYDESLENASDTQVYLSYVSHELRAPLQGIKGVADFLTRSRLPSDDYKHQVNILSTSCTQLLITASNVLDFEKFRSGYKVLNLGYVNIQEVVESVVKELQATSMLHNTVVKVYCPKIFVELDSVKISHVLRNLVSNALKFTKNGQVMVRVFESGENLHFSVADNGPGVAQNDRDGLFDNFQQGCNAKQDSSGLGLSVAKRCIELHNGKIWFEPNLPSGAVFSFTIPLKKEVEDDYDQECRGRIDSANVFWNNVDSGTVSKAQAWLRKQVLVALLVDDDEISVVSTGFMLEKLGFKVLYAMSFYSAIEVLSRDKIDIVLLDIMLGGQEFYECLNGVAKYAPEASIILQTGVSKGAVVTLADKYTQIVGYLMKPYGAEDMKGILRTLSHPPHSK
ncbi:hybrid sensor histidine kinase/response regulator [Candidatus Sneabacter namystus]|nr:hybrid sensor histidine kinase/response regulator [Candidatus Sneabacter namystus]